MNKQEVNIILKRHNLQIEGYKPGAVRLYAIYKDINNSAITPYMPYKEICCWLEGFDKCYDMIKFKQLDITV
jgi:hypothetical protein